MEDHKERALRDLYVEIEDIQKRTHEIWRDMFLFGRYKFFSEEQKRNVSKLNNQAVKVKTAVEYHHEKLPPLPPIPRGDK